MSAFDPKRTWVCAEADPFYRIGFAVYVARAVEIGRPLRPM